jgi:hypothetical protein
LGGSLYAARVDAQNPRQRDARQSNEEADVEAQIAIYDGNASVTEAIGFRRHRAERWATAIVGVLAFPADPRTIAGWAQGIGAGYGTLRSWCRAAGVSARNSLALSRMLRAVVLASRHRCAPQDVLDIVDERTLRKLVRGAGMASEPGESVSAKPLDVVTFIAHQRFVTGANNIAALNHALRTRGYVDKVLSS